MSIRSTHKAYLKSQIEQITFESTNLVADVHYNSLSVSDPYVFIQSQEVTMPLLDNRTYDIKYNYTVTYVFQILPDESDPMQEIRSDVLEGLLLTKLRSEEVRDNSADPYWMDLTVTSVSAPYSPDDSGEDGTIAKTITVEVFAVELLD